jgi:hypothetical protein
VYWYKFMWQGKVVRESTKQGKDKVARQMEAAHPTSPAKGEVGIREKKRAPTLAYLVRIGRFARTLSRVRHESPKSEEEDGVFQLVKVGTTSAQVTFCQIEYASTRGSEARPGGKPAVLSRAAICSGLPYLVLRTVRARSVSTAATIM